ncbi:hypothetical protein P7C71_g6091, partial [Lecanoromycetidae sp. Uapishka_2]
MPQKFQRTTLANIKKKPAERPSSPPNWPALRPLIASDDLSLVTLLEDQVVVVRSLLTPKLCATFVSFLSSLPLITTPVQPKAGNAVRVNDRIQFDDPAFAEQLWSSTALEKLVNGPGQFFGQHYDESNTIVLPTSPPTPAKTTWTLLIYLTGPATGCIGGETVFYPELGPAKKFSGKLSQGSEPLSVELEVGMALLHKHGQDCLLHEGRKVTKGEKWVIRSDLCVKR